jgi:hypothetical protein
MSPNSLTNNIIMYSLLIRIREAIKENDTFTTLGVCS